MLKSIQGECNFLLKTGVYKKALVDREVILLKMHL